MTEQSFPWKCLDLQPFTTCDNATLHYHYQKAEEKAKGTIVINLAWTMSPDVCSPLLTTNEKIKKHYDVYIVTVRGYEKEVSYGNCVDRCAIDLHEFIRHFKIDHFIAMGHSIGVAIWWQYMLTYGQKQFDKFILLDEMTASDCEKKPPAPCKPARPSYLAATNRTDMAHRTGQNRLQFGLFATPLDEMIAPDNMVRVIDAFADALDLDKLGFVHIKARKRGAPPYHPALLLKLYIYGYLNRVRSSRRLELECGRNIELFWLTGCQKPSYHTISDFRSIKPHRKALKATFRLFNQVLDGAGLFGKELVAVDGTKVRAQNSKKNNLSEDKIQKRLDYHESRFMEYLDELDRADDAILQGREPAVSPETIHKALDDIQLRTKKLEQLLEVLHEAQAEDPTVRQISLIDPDARSMPINNLGHTDIVYNVQSAVDAQHCLIAHFSIENIPDVHLLSQTATDAKTELGAEALEVLADKGYHYSAELQKCVEAHIITYVAYPDQDYKTKEEGFRKEDFEFDADNDIYICPIGEELTTNGTIYNKYGKNGQLQTRFRVYRLPYAKCQQCICADFCLTPASHLARHGRHVDRNIYEEALAANRLRVLNNRGIYKRRQAIVEHPFGTIKRSWGFYYTLLMGKEKVGAEYSLVFLAYNLRRAMSILGAKDLLKRVKAAFFNILALRRRTEHQNRGLAAENFGVVWRATAVQVARCAA